MKDDISDQDARFGTAIRAKRAQLGITLDQLAAASGVSTAALSRVERGLLSPTLRNALAIARGLGCEISELVDRENTKITRAGDHLRFFDEQTGMERLALARPTPESELLLYHVPKGAKSAIFAAHKPGTREIFHALSGQLTIHTDREVITLNAGDTAILQMDCAHWFHNTGGDNARIILMNVHG